MPLCTCQLLTLYILYSPHTEQESQSMNAGTESFEEWVSLLDDYLAEIVESVPTGRGQAAHFAQAAARECQDWVAWCLCRQGGLPAPTDASPRC